MSTRARTQARQIHQAVAVAERRTRRRNRVLAYAGGLLIVGLVVAIVISVAQSARRSEPASAASGPTVVPASATAAGAIEVGTATAPATVAVYLDYMCPYCGRFERANSAELERLVGDGTIRLELHVLSFLDKTSSGNRYSTRAANAVAVVADRAPQRVLAFNNALFVRQPAEGSSGLTDRDLAATAIAAGVPADVTTLFTAGRFEPWIAASTRAAFETGGITGTPTVRINGVAFKGDLYTVGPLTQAITAARGGR